jgi:hypothetical protein
MSELKTCFKKVDYDLSGLLHYIDIGDIGLPDIQRPFVWSNAKVLDLFDSMYRGFPKCAALCVRLLSDRQEAVCFARTSVATADWQMVFRVEPNWPLHRFARDNHG